MKKAIITGSTGLLGKCVSKYLLNRGIDTLCLGRQNLKPDEISKFYGYSARYICIRMEDIGSLVVRAKSIGWNVGEECVFFNFAWGGESSLTNGELSKQLENAIHAASAVRIAKQMGCIKFINVGSLEETYADLELKNKVSHDLSQMNYAISKLASRDLCKLVAYLEKIDYIHTRLSAPISVDLSNGGFITNTILAIKNGAPFERPINKKLFDIISTDDVAKAFFDIGVHGINKRDYFIGSSMPTTLDNFFTNIELLVQGKATVFSSCKSPIDSIFDTKMLKNDTGFSVKKNIFELLCL